MALIPDFPSFSPAPSAADLSLAARRIAEQLGGVLPDGTILQGNIDGDNLVASPGFRNEQKAEPYSESATVIGWQDEILDFAGASTGRFEIAPLPFDVVLTGVHYQSFALHKGTLTLTLGGRGDGYDYSPMPLAIFQIPTAGLSMYWKVGGLIPAGVPFGGSVTFDPVATDPWFVAFFLKALHRR